MWDLITLAQCPGSEMSPGLFQDFMDMDIRPQNSSLMVKHSVVVMSARLNPMGSQFSIPFCEICVQNQRWRKLLRPS